MQAIMFSTRSYEPERYQRANKGRYELEMVLDRLSRDTVNMAKGYTAVIAFVSDDLSAEILAGLVNCGVQLVICRSAGVDHVDLKAAHDLGLKVAHCPNYSPAAVAEFAVGLMLALNRKIIIAHEQVMQHNFTVDALLGTEFNHKTIGIIGTGYIGAAFARIMAGFGCRLLAYDPVENPECHALGVSYCSFEEVISEADVISLHVPLLSSTRYLINQPSIALMKRGVILVNTARGAVVDTAAVIDAVESGHISGYAADVYEHEPGVFFEDYSHKQLKDTLLEKLLNMRQVLITPHQAFFTETALQNMAANVFENLEGFASGTGPVYPV